MRRIAIAVVGTVENRAQSLTAFKVGRDAIVHADETSATK